MLYISWKWCSSVSYLFSRNIWIPDTYAVSFLEVEFMGSWFIQQEFLDTGFFEMELIDSCFFSARNVKAECFGLIFFVILCVLEVSPTYNTGIVLSYT